MSKQVLALNQLQNLSLRLNVSLTHDETLDAIIEAAMTICRADRAAISYLNDSGELNMLRHRGLSDEYINERKLTHLDPAIEKIILTREPLIIEDVEHFRGISPNYDAWKREGVGSIVTLPLVREGEVFGVIGAGSSAPRHYSQTEVDAMAVLAAQASAAVTNARLFEQLREANRAKDEFLSTLSHELRTPLTPILGWTHLLRQFSALDPLLAQGIETVERNANQLASLIKDLLDLTRIISGKIELERELVDLSSLVQSVFAENQEVAEDLRLDMKLNLPDVPIVSNVDHVRIWQVMSNLIGNALKFTPAGGRVTVTLRRDRWVPSSAIIEVDDSGIGIEKEFLPYVFERFAQGHGGINRRYGGLGLGLSIARAMVEMHGGQVMAESEGAGRGSRFTVKLPAVSATVVSNAAIPSKSAPEGEPEQLGLRVLVIEDSRDTINMLELWLKTYGCEALMATDASEGLRLAAEKNPDLILSDIGMPGVDGYQLIRELRATPGLKHTPAIALTGYAREEDRQMALAAGYNAHISKPAEMSHLLDLIKKLAKK
ncbi:MAG TPA: ATP-binding protein [Blastocatellia bacterium]|nr:ATP-binding protein [Blastocatellia bacterium]